MKASPIRCLISAGPTREFFDPVRFLSNPSSGKMGFALAAAAASLGWKVNLISGPVSISTPDGVERTDVVTGCEMFEAVQLHFPDCDILIMTAAVMDYRPKKIAPLKIKKNELCMVIEMEPVVDILATVAKQKSHQLIVGFAAETDHLEEYAIAKLRSKGADFIVANVIGGENGAFGRDDNQVTVFGRDGTKLKLGPLPKTTLAELLVARFARSILPSHSPV